MENENEPIFTVPYAAKDTGMAGQEEILPEVHKQLSANRRIALVHPANDDQLGGPGRTQLAAEYAHRYRREYPGGIAWLQAGQAIELQLVRMARQGGWVHPEEMDYPGILKDAGQHLNDPGCLVIFDEVEKLAAIERFLPRAKRGPHVLVTAREAPKGFTPLDIPLLDDEPALQTLLDEYRGNTAGLPVLEKEPLLKDILDLLAWSGTSFMGLSLMAALLDKNETDLRSSLTAALSLRLLQKAAAEERYRVHPLMRKAWRDGNPFNERKQWPDDICRRLGAWFEQRRKPFTDLPAFEIETPHLDEWAEHAKNRSSAHACRLTWLQAYPYYYTNDFQESLRRVQAALTMSEGLPEPGIGPELKANLYNDLGSITGAMEDHEESLKYHLLSLEIQRTHLGEEHTDTINSIENIGTAYALYGKYEESLQYHLQALEIRRKVFGEKDEGTAGALENVGDAHDNLGNTSEGLTYHRQALEIQEQLAGKYHPQTAAAFFNVIYSMIKLKDFSEAAGQLTPYLEEMPRDNPEYSRILDLRKFLNKERIKGSSRIPSKKKKKKKKK